MKYLVILSMTLLANCTLNLKCDVKSLNTTMTEADILQSCGKPDHINASTYLKQWVYSDWFLDKTYIYTKNGHFSSAQWKE